MLVWLVDAEDREVTVYQRGYEPYVLGEQDEITGEGVLPEFRCRVADFFRMPGEAMRPAAPGMAWPECYLLPHALEPQFGAEVQAVNQVIGRIERERWSRGIGRRKGG